MGHTQLRFTAKDGFDSDINLTDTELAALFNAVNPDLSQFRGRGGKLIHYHGWNDPDISPLNSGQLLRECGEGAGRRNARLDQYPNLLPLVHGAGYVALARADRERRHSTCWSR